MKHPVHVGSYTCTLEGSVLFLPLSWSMISGNLHAFIDNNKAYTIIDSCLWPALLLFGDQHANYINCVALKTVIMNDVA